mmetsp:Transcript_6889/g.9521  ORF Transcript_6889/g.9521 Transcript_6889/m.9521 type:complete len:395 (-) Transcript_6889:119-1303(-)
MGSPEALLAQGRQLLLGVAGVARGAGLADFALGHAVGDAHLHLGDLEALVHGTHVAALQGEAGEVEAVAGVLGLVGESGVELLVGDRSVEVEASGDLVAITAVLHGFNSFSGHDGGNLTGEGDSAGAGGGADGLESLGSGGQVVGLVVVVVAGSELGLSLVLLEVIEHLAKEAVELGVLLDVTHAVAASADNSVQLHVSALLVVDNERSLHIEGKVLLGNELVNVLTSAGSADDLAENLVLNSFVCDLGDERGLGDLGDLAVVVLVDVGNGISSVLHDLLDLLGGLRSIVLILDDVAGIVVGILHDLLDLFFLLPMSILDEALLSLGVDLSDETEAFNDLPEDGLDLLSGAVNGLHERELEHGLVDIGKIVVIDDRDRSPGDLLLDLGSQAVEE